MKLTMTILLSLMVVLLAGAASAQDFGPAGNGVCGFVDEDGDGFNDLAPDADGDGIPNGLDEDYVKPEDGTGYQHKYGSVEDEAFASKVADETAQGHRYGLADGTGTGTGPADGTGFGPGTGTGDCTSDGVPVGDQVQRRAGRR
jgi:hypothetical protein